MKTKKRKALIKNINALIKKRKDSLTHDEYAVLVQTVYELKKGHKFRAKSVQKWVIIALNGLVQRFKLIF